MTLGERLRRARLEKELTQSELAGTQITRNMLSQIENDVASPSVKTLEYLAARLNVRVGALLDDEPGDETSQKLSQARVLLQKKSWRACLALVQPLSGDEAKLLAAVSAAQLAQQALCNEDIPQAQQLAELALSFSEQSVYRSESVRLSMHAVLMRCAQKTGQNTPDAVASYRSVYLQAQNAVTYHLLMARYQLEQEHIQAAEREIWSIVDLPESSRAEYLVLRGRIAAKKEQYENAILYLQQAEQLPQLPRIVLRELYRCMELCCRETEDFKHAYEYAAKQLALDEG